MQKKYIQAKLKALAANVKAFFEYKTPLSIVKTRTVLLRYEKSVRAPVFEQAQIFIVPWARSFAANGIK